MKFNVGDVIIVKFPDCECIGKIENISSHQITLVDSFRLNYKVDDGDLEEFHFPTKLAPISIDTDIERFSVASSEDISEYTVMLNREDVMWDYGRYMDGIDLIKPVHKTQDNFRKIYTNILKTAILKKSKLSTEELRSTVINGLYSALKTQYLPVPYQKSLNIYRRLDHSHTDFPLWVDVLLISGGVRVIFDENKYIDISPICKPIVDECFGEVTVCSEFILTFVSSEKNIKINIDQHNPLHNLLMQSTKLFKYIDLDMMNMKSMFELMFDEKL